VEIGIEMFGRDGEFFVSILEMDEKGYFVISMTVTSIDKEPFCGIIIIRDIISDIFLDRLSLNIITISSSNEIAAFDSHK